MATFESRYWAKVDRTGDCWVWKASVVKGYGQIRRKVGDKHTVALAHRVAYEMCHGEIPAGLQVLHRCDNPLCVRPSHLFLGTNKENNDDKMRKGRHGHGTQHGEQASGAKLTEDSIRQIRSMRAQGMLLREIGEKFGVHYMTIGQIVSGKTWKHVLND